LLWSNIFIQPLHWTFYLSLSSLLTR
jgi:hypothetical protein